MEPIELRKNLSEHMKQVKREYANQGMRIFFAYATDGYLRIYEFDETNFWKNGNFIKIYINKGD